ncbi:hypothetical protein AA313_de0206063 [Arthrobotrys entomopaga]|nr:hypothetical protein AA313_de0206063 [Arthrobotrys entomopaga]
MLANSPASPPSATRFSSTSASTPNEKATRSTQGSHRRRSTSSVFSDPRNINLPRIHPSHAASESAHPKPKPLSKTSESSLSREVQQDAIELSGVPIDDAEAQEREELAEILAQGDWDRSEIALFRRLRRRGREPLLPAPWRLDFATFPEALYSPVGERSFICALTPSMEFRGEDPMD